MKLPFDYTGPCTLYVRNIVAEGYYGERKNGKVLRFVSVCEGGEQAQYDRSIWICALLPRRRKPNAYRIVPDGLTWAELEIDGHIVWDSSDGFPVFASLNDRARISCTVETGGIRL